MHYLLIVLFLNCRYHFRLRNKQKHQTENNRYSFVIQRCEKHFQEGEFCSGGNVKDKEKKTNLKCKYSPSIDSLFGVLDAPSPPRNPGLAKGGVCTRDDELAGFRVADIGADIDGRRFTKLNGLPSSESLSPVDPNTPRNKFKYSKK